MICCRPIAVSAYFHIRRWQPERFTNITVDEFVLQVLPNACKWVFVRYLLFAEMMAQTSSMFWYDDSLNRTVDWHKQFYDFTGLNVPNAVISRAADVAAGRANDSRLAVFPHKGVDEHLGGRSPATGRSYRDEVLPETAARMDEILRFWLPPVLQERFGVGILVDN